MSSRDKISNLTYFSLCLTDLIHDIQLICTVNYYFLFLFLAQFTEVTSSEIRNWKETLKSGNELKRLQGPQQPKINLHLKKFEVCQDYIHLRLEPTVEREVSEPQLDGKNPIFLPLPSKRRTALLYRAFRRCCEPTTMVVSTKAHPIF